MSTLLSDTVYKPPQENHETVNLAANQPASYEPSALSALGKDGAYEVYSYTDGCVYDGEWSGRVRCIQPDLSMSVSPCSNIVD